jgi:hypothetical protein
LSPEWWIGLLKSSSHQFAFDPSIGETRMANAYEEERRINDGFASTLGITASIIAAVWLTREREVNV